MIAAILMKLAVQRSGSAALEVDASSGGELVHDDRRQVILEGATGRAYSTLVGVRSCNQLAGRDAACADVTYVFAQMTYLPAWGIDRLASVVRAAGNGDRPVQEPSEGVARPGGSGGACWAGGTSRSGGAGRPSATGGESARP